MTQIFQNRLKLFLALSRTPHGIIDMAAPALAALLCLGHFPPIQVTLVGIVTVFAGYTAVYALNDLVDLRTDRQKVDIGGYSDGENYLDGVMMRHPMAKGALSFKAGLAWAVGWAILALAGAYWLNPVCLYIFLAGCLLEGLYCKLWRVTPLRALVNGAVKTLGSVAAVFAVDPSPSPLFLIALFAWMFAWEIGGQNIPNDWTDIEEDRHFKAQTIPLRLGLHKATLVIVACLTATLFLNIVLLWVSPLTFGILPMIVVVAVNVLLLLHPALLLVERQKRELAMTLFNKASYYPLAILGIVLVRLAY
ncbi:UbiA family prenyltransferase [Desulfatitalea tepidiphila]|uniref:UbiA family prenyltransferase n=1 Tax=Desulfatitalea tepidiphila TaxID=1185843 RepID=UPI0006B5FBA2|nr:UbiA family prenyltransferase [Desulfatitalea tepidiphila]